MKKAPWIIAIFFTISIMSCATTLKPGAERIRVLQSISADEEAGYDDLGVVQCEEVAAVHDVEESCKMDLKNKALDRDADTLVIRKTERKTCWIGRGSDCVTISAKAYRNKNRLIKIAQGKADGKVLVVLSGKSELTLKNGKKHRTGFYLNELAVPLKALIDAGYEPVFATPQAEVPQMDPGSDTAAEFGNDPKKHQEARALLDSLKGLKNPIALKDIAQESLDEFKGILVPGGHAPMEDLAKDPGLARALRHFHLAAKPTGLICHGPVALLSANEPSGKWLYQGYEMTVFTTAEERIAEKNFLKGQVPWYPQEELKKAGGRLRVGDPFESHVRRDRELITAQNPASDQEFAKAFVSALLDRESKPTPKATATPN